MTPGGVDTVYTMRGDAAESVQHALVTLLGMQIGLLVAFLPGGLDRHIMGTS